MKNKVIYIFTILMILISSCQRNDIVLLASDELHMLFLYKENNDFDISYISSTYSGKYEIKGDTIYLNYTEEENKQRSSLNHKLLINREKNKVSSFEGDQQFCAYGNLDIPNTNK